MPYLNNVIVMGHAGRDAETRTVRDSTVSNFTLAVTEKWKDKQSGEWKEQTNWINVVAWRSEKVCQYVTKGKLVLVTGKLTTRSYDDKDGKKVYVTEVVADSVKPIDTVPRGERKQDAAPVDDTDVPF